MDLLLYPTMHDAVRSPHGVDTRQYGTRRARRVPRAFVNRCNRVRLCSIKYKCRCRCDGVSCVLRREVFACVRFVRSAIMLCGSVAMWPLRLN